MFDLVKGLNAREELLDYLRFLLRYEEQLLLEGWYSESDFEEELFSTIKALAELLPEE